MLQHISHIPSTGTSGATTCNSSTCLSPHTKSRTMVRDALELKQEVAFHTWPHCTIWQVSNVVLSFPYDDNRIVFLLHWINRHTLRLLYYATNQIIVKIQTIHQPPWPFRDLFRPPKSCTIAPLRKLLRTCAQSGWEMKAIVGYGVGETQPFQRCINGRHRLSCARCG